MKLFLIPLFTFISFSLFSQELNCSVQVLSVQPQNSTDKKISQTLQQSIFEFMNNRKWTNDVFQLDERIECTIIISITDKPSTEEFKCNMQIQARRPIYKSSYNSLILNILDKNISFKYVEYQPLEFSDNSFMSNLTSLLGYYAYMIIGTDYDSFSKEGGNPYFQKAQTIVSNAQNTSDKGWKSYEDNQNRYWIIENLLNATFKPLRECFYMYHKNGFDVMSEDLVGGRSKVLQSIQLLMKIHETKPGSYSLLLFFLAKADEIVNLYSLADAQEKTKVVELLKQIDPANNIKYNKITQGRE